VGGGTAVAGASRGGERTAGKGTAVRRKRRKMERRTKKKKKEETAKRELLRGVAKLQAILWWLARLLRPLPPKPKINRPKRQQKLLRRI
jgi:hypothetical protein